MVDRSTTKRNMTQKMLDEERQKTLGILVAQAIEAEGNFLHVYDTLLQKVDRSGWREQIEEFQGDHEGHVHDLRDVARRMDLDVPVVVAEPTALGRELSDTIKGLDNEGRIVMEALVAENVSRSFYGMTLGMDAPEDIRKVLRKAHDDEERHHRWVAQQVATVEK